jgi:hypothetical protein
VVVHGLIFDVFFVVVDGSGSFGGGHGGSVVLWLDALCLCAMCNQYDKADAYHSLNADHKHNF